MLAPEEQQIEICLLKANLGNVVDTLVAQCTSWPELDAEYDQRSRETMMALKEVRSVKMEVEKLKQENVHLTAKRKQLKRQCDEIATNLETAREYRQQQTECLEQEKQEIELQIRKYENSLQGKAERFRKSHGYYNEDAINEEIKQLSNIISELNQEMKMKQEIVDDLKEEVEAIHTQVPESLLEIVGKQQLEDRVKFLTDKYEQLVAK